MNTTENMREMRGIRKRKRKDLSEIIKPDQFKIPIIKYLLGPDWNWAEIGKTEIEPTETDKFIYQVGEKINELKLQDFIK